MPFLDRPRILFVVPGCRCVAVAGRLVLCTISRWGFPCVGISGVWEYHIFSSSAAGKSLTPKEKRVEQCKHQSNGFFGVLERVGDGNISAVADRKSVV